MAHYTYHCLVIPQFMDIYLLCVSILYKVTPFVYIHPVLPVCAYSFLVFKLVNGIDTCAAT